MIVLADPLAPFLPPVEAEKVTIWGSVPEIWVTDLDKDTVNSHA